MRIKKGNQRPTYDQICQDREDFSVMVLRTPGRQHGRASDYVVEVVVAECFQLITQVVTSYPFIDSYILGMLAAHSVRALTNFGILPSKELNTAAALDPSIARDTEVSARAPFREV